MLLRIDFLLLLLVQVCSASMQSPATTNPSPTQPATIIQTLSSDDNPGWHWVLYADEPQLQVDEGKEVLVSTLLGTGWSVYVWLMLKKTAVQVADDGRALLTDTITGNPWANELMARTVTHQHPRPAATNSPREAQGPFAGEVARSQISVLSAGLQSNYDYIQSQFDAGKTVAVGSSLTGGMTLPWRC